MSYPMDGAEERDDDSAISELQRLNEVQEVLRRFMFHENHIVETIARRNIGIEIQG